MALRKRSYKFGSDKWLGVALHNMRVDALRDRQEKENRTGRLASIRTKLRGEGIDGSWAHEALGIMESNGYGLNQFSNRVLPLLRQRIRDDALEQNRQAGEKELKRQTAERRTIEAAAAKQQRKLCEDQRRELASKVRIARANAEKITWADPGLKEGELNRKAISSTLGEITADITSINATLTNPSSSIHEIDRSVGKSFYFDFARKGFLKCLVIVWLEAVIAYQIFALTNEWLKGVTPNAAAAFAIMFAFLVIPVLLIRHFMWLRRPRIRLSIPSASLRHQTLFLAMTSGHRILPPKFGSSNMPDDNLAQTKGMNTALRAAIKQP